MDANSLNRKDCSSLTGYKALPESVRTRNVWYWLTPWYKVPHALLYSINSGEVVTDTEGWEAWDKYIRKEYPLQSRIRDFATDIVYSSKRKCSNLKYTLKALIKRPRKEMIAAIYPRDYVDIKDIITNTCFQAVIEYIERKKAFEHIDWSEHNSKEKAELFEAYEYITIGRKKLQKSADEFWETFQRDSSKSPEEQYKTLNEIESQIEAFDTKYCKWVVENRSLLWC